MSQEDQVLITTLTQTNSQALRNGTIPLNLNCRKNSLEKPAKPAAAKRTKKPAKIDVDSDIEIDEDSQSEDDMFAATPPTKQINNGK